MFAIDSLVIDLVFGADARPTAQGLLEGLGGEEVAKTRLVVDPDLDAPEYEMQVSPTVPLRRRGERRLLIVDETVAPLREDPQADPMVPYDLRPERDRLVALVEKTGARLGRLQAFGTWGDAVTVVRTLRDLRGLALLPWALDPRIDLDGRRRATPLTREELTEKVGAFDLRLDELDDAEIETRIAPAHITRQGALIIVDLISPEDGSWDVRHSLELDQRVSAIDRFSRIPGAKTTLAPTPALPPSEATTAPLRIRAETPPPVPAAEAAAEPPEPPRPAGPPIDATELDGRVVLRVPAGRWNLDIATALGQRHTDVLTSQDPVPGKLRDKIHHEGCGFVAPLEFLSEVFIDGRPLDRRRFDAEARDAAGLKLLEAHLPRFGPVLVMTQGTRRFVTSEIAIAPERIAPLIAGL